MPSVSRLPTAYHVFGTDKARGKAKRDQPANIYVPPQELESRPNTVTDEAIVEPGGDSTETRDHGGVGRC